MRNVTRTTIAVLAAGLLLLAGTVSARAQDTGETWNFDARGGVSVPVGDFEDLPFESVNPTGGIGATYWLSPHFGVQASGDWERYLGDESELAPGVTGAPDMNIFHYNAAVVADVAPASSPWDLQVNVGGGGTTYDSDDFAVAGGPADSFSETYLSGTGGLKIGYDVTRSVNVFVGGQAYVAFPDEEDTQRLAQLSDAARPLDTAWTVPLLAGVKVEF